MLKDSNVCNNNTIVAEASSPTKVEESIEAITEAILTKVQESPKPKSKKLAAIAARHAIKAPTTDKPESSNNVKSKRILARQISESVSKKVSEPRVFNLI